MSKAPVAGGDKPKSRRGGARLGPDGKSLAGRKKKAFQAPAALTPADLADALATPPPEEIDGLAQHEARSSISAMAHQMIRGASEAAKIAAAVVILDRGYGKPAVEIGGDAALMLPLMLPPSVQDAAAVVTTAEIRSEARRYAVLAIEVLKRIRDHGESESARVSAGKAILDRGLGTVGKARMPDEQTARPLGKKEEAARAAETAATGRYATPAPPRHAGASERVQ